MAAVLEENGYVSVLADAFSGDPGIDDAEFHCHYLLSMVRNGSVLLMHSPESDNHRSQTLAALDALIPNLLNEGYGFVTLDAMLQRENKFKMTNTVVRESQTN
uniref:NodB homology domain-containing protein n=1 Tax=Norrisiella sphaerica TaxID=552664 RepID=A0A7S2VUS7_9EUKA